MSLGNDSHQVGGSPRGATGTTRIERNTSTFQRILRFIQKNQGEAFKKAPNGRSLLYREVARCGVSAFEGKRPVVWTTSYVFPMEFIWGLGLLPVDFEIYAGLMSAANQGPRALKAADGWGLPQDTCTIHRIAVGAVLLEEFPKPDLLVSTTHYCDGKAKTNEIMARHYGVDYMLLDMPLEDGPEARHYVKEQLQLIFSRLCALAGKAPDQGLLGKPIYHFNQMTGYMRRVNELRKGRPAPFLPNNGCFDLHFMNTLLYGTPWATEIYRLLEAQWREELRTGSFKPEKLRFLWLMASPTYAAPIFPWMEQRGARIVMEELGHCYWKEMDLSRPLDSMVERLFSNPFHGKVERRAKLALQLAKAYGVDAALHMGHLPCRQSNGALQVIRDALEDHGIRLIQLEADLADPSGFPTRRIQEQLQAYWEILSPRLHRASQMDGPGSDGSGPQDDQKNA